MEKPAMMAAVAAPAVIMTPQVARREPAALRRGLLRLRLVVLLLGSQSWDLARPMEAAWCSRTICRGGLCLGGCTLLREDTTLAPSSDLRTTMGMALQAQEARAFLSDIALPLWVRRSSGTELCGQQLWPS